MNLQEALDMGPIGKDPTGRIAIIEAAARSVVEGTDTPDYEAAIEVDSTRRPGVGPVTDRARIMAIVDAAVKGRLLVEKPE